MSIYTGNLNMSSKWWKIKLSGEQRSSLHTSACEQKDQDNVTLNRQTQVATGCVYSWGNDDSRRGDIGGAIFSLPLDL